MAVYAIAMAFSSRAVILAAILGLMIGAADRAIRLSVFDWLTDQRAKYGEALPRTVLEAFELSGRRIPLMGPSGIWKPAACELPISIATVTSGPLALCKLHHAAFDSFFFAVRPDYVIEVRPSILAESDGPMLVVGLQEIHGRSIALPSRATQLPDPDRLARRYELFREAS